MTNHGHDFKVKTRVRHAPDAPYLRLPSPLWGGDGGGGHHTQFRKKGCTP